jgi:hypothetical protein
MLMSNRLGVDDKYGLYSCNTSKFPTGGPGPFMDCSTVNPLVDIMCAGCHGQNEQLDGSGNIISYSNIVDGTAMNVFKVLDGTTEVTEYIPGHEYTIELNMNTFAVRKGFDVTICSSTGDNGTFTQILTEPGVQVFNDPNFMYATHTDNTGTDLWRWKWVAPSVDPGPLTFDILTLKDNSPISTADSLYVSHVPMSPLPAGLVSQSFLNGVLDLWVDNTNQTLFFKFEENYSSPINLEMYTSSGQRVLSQKINDLESSPKEIRLPSGTEAGIYIVRLTNDLGQTINRKVFISSDL